MPFKHNAACRHRIPQARYQVRNWRDYEAGLKRRGDLTLWLDEAVLAGWQAPPRTTPGGQARYSDVAIELVLILRSVLHLALRQAEGFAASVLRLLGQELRVPDHTTLCRRGRGFAGRCPKILPHGPMHLVIDSTGLKLFGRGEWNGEGHGRARRSWRKLHLGVDAGTGEIVACMLADSGAEDADAQGQRDRHIRLIAERGRMAWQRSTGYGRRSLAETAVGRHKAIVGPKLRARSLPAQQGEAAMAAEVLNRMIRAAKPLSIRAA